ncbi:MAG: PAS domain S-box protein [Magnetococcales bacterium]|nr:PAS domain S-box protein [Magnetococcales bacterium]
MNASGLLRWGVGIAFAVIMTFLAVMSEVDDGELRLLERSITQLAKHDANLNQDLVLIRHGLLKHYDTTVIHVRAMGQELAGLHKLSENFYGNGHRVAAATDRLHKLFKIKSAEIEQFKSMNAVLKNSLTYFPIGMKEMLQELEKWEQDGAKKGHLAAYNARELLIDLVTMGGTGVDSNAEQIARDRLWLLLKDTREAPEPLSGHIRNLRDHAHVILNLKIELDILLNTILNRQVSDWLERVTQLSRQVHSARLKEASHYRTLLFLMALALLGLLIFSMWQLRRSLMQQRRLMQAVEASADAIVITNPKGIIEYVNPGFSTITGWSSEEALGKTPGILKSGLTDQSIYDDLWLTLRERRQWRGVFLNRKKKIHSDLEGELYWCQAAIAPILDQRGKLDGYVNVQHDITEIKLVEENLRDAMEEAESASRTKEVVNFILELSLQTQSLKDSLSQALDKILSIPWLKIESKGAIFLLDGSGQNLILTAQHGLHPELLSQCARLPLGRCHCGRAALERKTILATHLDEQHEITYEGIQPHGHICLPILSSDKLLGVLNLYLTSGVGLETNQEEFLQVVTNTLAGLIERKYVEDELRKLSYAVEQSPAIVVITDLDGTVQYVNPKFSEITGYSPDEVIGQHTRMLKSGHTSQKEYKRLWRTILDGGEWRGEFRSQRKDGALYWESASISPIRTPDGTTTHFIAVKEEITQRKEMEEELRKAKKIAEGANRAKSDFLANMSHEIRTPMNAIMGMTGLSLQTETTPKQRDYLEKINNASHSLLRILNDILDFSKIEAGRLEMESIPFRMENVLDNLGVIISLKAQEKGLEFLYRTDRRIPPVLVGDPLRLEQVLINLAGNAVKFTERGEVMIAMELEESLQEQAVVRFSVRDSGIGMTEAQKAHLFQSFSQADSSTTRRFGGTGLGLSISKRLVEMMDGIIEVVTEPGKGSLFTFTARFGVQELVPQKELTPAPDLRHLEALVVDDNASAREILTEMLESFSFQVSSVTSGDAAITLLEKKERDGTPIQLITMDWKMPGMDGLTAARHIRSNTTITQQPKIVLLTAFDDAQARREADSLALDGYLTKPVNHSQLFDALMQAFGKEGSHSASTRRSISDFSQLFQEVPNKRILLVEDNEVNQQVAMELLELVGLTVQLAVNGEEAVKMVREGTFAAVLMDLQMPVMGGMEATERIRNEKIHHALPIIAMTANAMTGEKERCLNAGMNDYVSKPIDINLLFQSLLRHIHPEGDRSLQRISTSNLTCVENDSAPLPDLPGFDLQQALAKLGGNRRLYRKLVEKFLENQTDAVSKMEQALEKGDREEALRQAHTLKGIAGSLGAKGLQTAAADLEAALNDSDSENDLESLTRAFAEAMEHMLPTLQQAFTTSREEPAEEKEPLDTARLLALLLQLQPHLQKRKPRPCVPILDQMQKAAWPDELSQSVTQLRQLVRKYKLKDALILLEQMIQDLKKKEPTNE